MSIEDYRMPTKAELVAKIEALEELKPMYKRTACIHRLIENPFMSVPSFFIDEQINNYRVQLAAMAMEPEIPTEVQAILQNVDRRDTERAMDAMYGPSKSESQDTTEERGIE